MFAKLKRAKSFIHRSKHDDEIDLDLSEYSHLRRNVAIDGQVLQKQKQLAAAREQVTDYRKSYSGGLEDKQSKHNNFDRRNPTYFSERLQLPNLNRQQKEERQARLYFDRTNPAYVSERTSRQPMRKQTHINFDRNRRAASSDGKSPRPMARHREVDFDSRNRAEENNSPRLSDRRFFDRPTRKQ